MMKTIATSLFLLIALASCRSSALWIPPPMMEDPTPPASAPKPSSTEPAPVDWVRPAWLPRSTPASYVFASPNGDGIAAARMQDPEPTDPIEEVQSLVHVDRGPSACHFVHRWNKGAAVHVNPHRNCIVGKEFVATFQHSFVALPGGQRQAWLLVSTAPTNPPMNLTPFGMNKCWLLVNTAKDHLHVLRPSPGSVLRQGHGCLVLRWTPALSMLSAQFSAQMVWLEPNANAAHTLVSPALRVRVGTN